ncbi:phosphodiester glycosidase family protein [Paenibacillus filicis]|uniref:Phosphodiester glycosidase family protein n=1 Tax=Paenibacillus gyeongsangnamensis TaxID=3388067 RepID=A0ABT4Q7J2_9BACL|nr:phosphodiester glycosidase family protein [Paenibacillus filicis]MCZ8512680.1 phosphodiester glycosidase family protein [Paenibacillus filicis]
MTFRKPYRMIFAAAAVMLICFSRLASAAEPPIAHEHRQVQSNGATYTLDIIRVNLKDPTIQVKAVAANRELGSVEKFSDMLADNDAAAGINGTFFDAFTEDISYRTPYGLVMNNNDLLYSGDKETSITVSTDKEASVQRLQVNSTVRAGSWSSLLAGVDVYYGDVPHSAWLFTKDYGDDLSYPGVKIVVGPDGKVASVTAEGTAAIPAGGKVLLLSSDFTFDRTIKIVKAGDKFSVSQTVTNLDTKASVPIDQVRMAIGAGPKLVTEGRVDLDFERDRFNDPLVTERPNVRSFAGVDQEGKLVFGTVSYCTIEQMADVMVEIGMKDAINLDGGASSALYYKGRMLRAPGRLLSNALIVRQTASPQVQLQVNGQSVGNYYGYVDQDVTMVPFRVLLNRLKEEYRWDGATSSLSITKDKAKLEVSLGSRSASVNGRTVTMDAEPQIVDGHLYVPLRFVAEALGAQVDWNGDLYRANVKPSESQDAK